MSIGPSGISIGSLGVSLADLGSNGTQRTLIVSVSAGQGVVSGPMVLTEANEPS